MIVIYRTNAGFEGKIVYIDRQGTVSEFSAWLAEAGEPLACLQIEDKLLDPTIVADMLVNRESYAVVNGALQKGGANVTLGYTPGDADSNLAALRSDTAVQALLTWTPTQAATWIASKTTAQVFLVIFLLLQKMIKSSRLAG